MEIQSAHRQSFGRIIAPEKYVGQQLAKIKDSKGKTIARGLLRIVKQSDVVDIFVSKKGEITLRYKEPYTSAIGMKSRKMSNQPRKNTFVEALLWGAYDDSEHAFRKHLFAFLNGHFEPYSYGFRVKDASKKYSSLKDAIKYGTDNLVKINN